MRIKELSPFKITNEIVILLFVNMHWPRKHTCVLRGKEMKTTLNIPTVKCDPVGRVETVTLRFCYGM